MRLSRKARRWILISAGTTVVALSVLWILRWKILEDRVRTELQKIAADLFNADVKVGSLQGSLLTSIQADDVTLIPRAESPFREFKVKRLEVGYGLFGTGTLDVSIDGGRVVLAESKSKEPTTADDLLDTARDISKVRFPGRLKARNSTFVVPGVPELGIESGEIDYGTWRVTLKPVTIRLKPGAEVTLGRMELELEPGRLSILEEGEGGLLVAAAWSRDESTLEIHWGRADGDLVAFKGRVEPDLDATLSARLVRLDTPLLRALITGLPLEGDADLKMKLGGTAETPTIDGRLLLLGLRLGEDRIERLDFPLKAEPGALVLPRTTQETPVGPVTLEGRIPFPWVRRESRAPVLPEPPVPDEPVVKTPDVPLPPVLPDPPMTDTVPDVPTFTIAANVEGILRRLPLDIRPWIPGGHVQFQGTFEGEGLKVTGHFEGERYEFPDPVGVLTNYEVDAELTATTLTIRKLKGLLGGGPVEASGAIDLTKPDAPLILNLKGTELLVVTDDLARIRINPTVTVTITPGPHVTIKGDVEVPLALYYTEFGPAAPEGGRRRDTSSPFGLRLLPSETGGFRIPGIRDLDRVTLDVNVKTTGECRIENSTIGAIVETGEEGLRLTGPASSPGVSGEVRVVRGQVRLTSGLFLKIKEAMAWIPADPARQPYVQFEGSVGRFDREIVVSMHGPLSNPTLRLSSNPPKSDEEILAILAFGRTPGNLEGSDVLGTLTEKMIAIYGDAWPSPDYEESLFDRLGIRVYEQGAERPVPPWELPTRGTSRGTTVRSEYLLNEFLSVVAESDREANLSGDLKLRLRFR